MDRDDTTAAFDVLRSHLVRGAPAPRFGVAPARSPLRGTTGDAAGSRGYCQVTLIGLDTPVPAPLVAFTPKVYVPGVPLLSVHVGVVLSAHPVPVHT